MNRFARRNQGPGGNQGSPIPPSFQEFLERMANESGEPLSKFFNM